MKASLVASRGAVSVPRLVLRGWRGGAPRNNVVHYAEGGHNQIPHVIKFSGGRSSGMLLLMLLENNLLKPDRGDVVLFTNTSAEHPITYDFVGKIKRLTEKKGIPFFIAQLQTVETVIGGEWRRRITYRLANARPFSKQNPMGYSYRGEVFEEAIAWTGMLPSVHTRICTTLMKMFVTREFLSDWLGGRRQLPLQGHASGTPQLDPDILYRLYKHRKGTMSREQYEMRQQMLSRKDTYRPQQHMQDYTKAKLSQTTNPYLSDSILGDRCLMFGPKAAPFLTFLGFRAGETARYQRMIQRNNGGDTPGHDTHPTNEYSYAPLVNLDIDQQDVLRFWSRQHGSIRPHLPADLNLSNCVYCFLKGTKALIDINKRKGEIERQLPPTLRRQCRTRNTPHNIGWWDKFEQQYSRKSNKQAINGEAGNGFGMFGLKNLSYKQIRLHQRKRTNGNGKAPDEMEQQSALTCECTD